MDGGHMELARLRDALGGAIDQFKKLWPESSPGRLQINHDRIQEVLDLQQGKGRAGTASMVRSKERQQNLVWVVTESYQIILIDQWLREADTDQKGKYYKWLAKGGAVSREEAGKRDAKTKEGLSYQLGCAALLYFAGCRDIEVNDQSNPDVAGTWGDQRIVMECKHVTSLKTVYANAKAANKRLRGGDLQIIAMDVSVAIHRGEFWARDWGDSEIQETVFSDLEDICKKQEDRQQRSKLDNCHGLLVEAAVPYANSQSGPSTCFGAIGLPSPATFGLMQILEHGAGRKTELLFSPRS